MAPVMTDAVRAAIEAREGSTATLRDEMVQYIRTHFADVLGSDAALLDTPGGLDALAAKMHARLRERSV